MTTRRSHLVPVVLHALPAALFWILAAISLSNTNACVEFYRPPCDPYRLTLGMLFHGTGLWVGFMVLGTLIDVLWRRFRHPVPTDELPVDQWQRAMDRRINVMLLLHLFLPSLLPPLGD